MPSDPSDWDPWDPQEIPWEWLHIDGNVCE